MCIGIWTLEHPDYALILCTNRDEYLARPTLNAQFHSFGVADTDQPHQVLSGRDELAGGSWFGINRTGKVALLTNITEPSMRYNTSRGNLVSSFLLSNPGHHHMTSDDQVRNNIVPYDDDDSNTKFAGFNLLLLTPTRTSTSTSTSTIRYESSILVTNHGGGGIVTSRTLTSSERSCGALSNGIDSVDAHLWPKVLHATAHFPAVVESRSTDPTDVELVEHLFQLLAWQPQDCTISQRSELRKTIQVSPMPLSSLSTASGNLLPSVAPYGTRLSTVLLVRNNGQVLFIERDIWKLDDDDGVGGGGIPFKSDPPTERKYNFNLDIESESH